MKCDARFSSLIRTALRVVGVAVLLSVTHIAWAEGPAWIEKSNLNAKVLLDATNKFAPENASSTGFAEFDANVTDLGPRINQRIDDAVIGARNELQKRILSETDPLVRQDLEILMKSAVDLLETNRLTNKDLLPFVDVGQLIFYGEFGLLQEQIAANRQPAALARLKRYTGLEPGTTPITELAKARYSEVAVDPALIGPFKNLVHQA